MRKHAISFAESEKLTRDSFADECDINRIVDQYARTGMVNHVPRTEPQYGEAPDLSSHEAACIAAQAATLVEEGWRQPTPEENAAPAPSEALPQPAVAEPPEGSAPVEASGE